MSVVNRVQAGNENTPLVSVYILSYFSDNFIYTCIDSILRQDYPRIELVVSDDGSTDFDSEKIKQYVSGNASSNIVNCIVETSESNQGTVRNSNKAILLSSGDYLKGIAADDKLREACAISEYVEYCERHREYDIVFANTVLVHPDGHEEVFSNRKQQLKLSWTDDVFAKLCTGNMFIAGSSFMRKSFYQKYGYYDERFVLLEDWPMWLNAAHKGCHFGLLDKALFEYNAGVGISSAESNPKYERDMQNCYLYYVLPYIHRLPKNKRLHILDEYYTRYIYKKGFFRNISFLFRRPEYLLYKVMNKLVRWKT